MLKIIRILFILILFSLNAACAPTAPYQAYKGKTAREIFASGETSLQKKRYEEAVKDFEVLDTLYPFGPYSEQGQLDIIYAYYKAEDAASALAATDRYVRLYPRSPNVDYAYYMKGLINYGRGETWFQRMFPTDPSWRDLSYMQQAFRDFNDLVRHFPNSQYAADAHKRMLYIRNLLAQQDLNKAQFYLRHKAYVAAVNRATWVVEAYQGAPQVIPALEVMIAAYQGMGETRLAEETQHVLVLNYPQSMQAKKLASAQKTKAPTKIPPPVTNQQELPPPLRG